jgi:hypothetical protein
MKTSLLKPTPSPPTWVVFPSEPSRAVDSSSKLTPFGGLCAVPWAQANGSPKKPKSKVTGSRHAVDTITSRPGRRLIAPLLGVSG